MTQQPQRLLQNGPPDPPPDVTQKCMVIYKLLLLENARNTLDQELRKFTNKAYEEVQGFLNSPLPTMVHCDIMKALDAKRHAIDKVLSLSKPIINDPQFCVQASAENGVITKRLLLNKDEGILMTDVLKFGPMLQNVLMANSITKTAQVLGATQFLISQPKAVQNDVMICSMSPSFNTVVHTSGSSCHFKDKEKEHAVIFEESPQPDVLSEPPAIIQCQKDNTKRPPTPFPIKSVLAEISNSNPMKITVDAPLIGWGCENDVRVQHQKQTSSQLLHFLRTNAKNKDSLEVAFIKWRHNIQYASSLPQPTSPTMKIKSHQFRPDVADDERCAPTPKKRLLAETENQAPVFKVKRVESSGSLTYTWVIATKTELWDIGHIFTEARQDPSEASPLEKEMGEECRKETSCHVEKSTVSPCLKTQSLQATEPELQHSSAVGTTSLINHISIPEFHIRKFDEIEVVVSHIVSPGNFFIQHADSIMKLQALVTDSWKASSAFAEQNCIPDIGTHVMAWFPTQKQWCRARVIKICGVSGDNGTGAGAGSGIDFKVEVKKLDHGDTACLSLWNIKELTAEMAALPLQAAQVSLANVTPVNGTDWSEEAVGWFRAMVHNRTLYARLYPQGSKVTVELFLNKGKMGTMRRGASLSLRLAQNGHANHDKLKNVDIVKRSASQLKMRKQKSDWEKYLISCYAQNKK